LYFTTLQIFTSLGRLCLRHQLRIFRSVFPLKAHACLTNAISAQDSDLSIGYDGEFSPLTSRDLRGLETEINFNYHFLILLRNFSVMKGNILTVKEEKGLNTKNVT
jgi:hypothetical protein